jgi:hypothetical protein
MVMKQHIAWLPVLSAHTSAVAHVIWVPGGVAMGS